VSEFAARFRIQLDGGQEFIAWTEKANAGVKQLERNHTSAMSMMSRSLKATAEDTMRLGLALGKTALSVGNLNLGLAAQAKGILEFRNNVTQLATTANVAESSIGGLRDQIQNVAIATGQMREHVSDALGAFVEKTGNIDAARKNLELYAKTARATNADLAEVALVGAELSQKMGIHDQRSALGILAAQSDKGAIEFRHLAVQGPRLFSEAAGAGFKGEEGVRKIGGLAQVFAEGVGGPTAAARVATSVENLFSDVSRPKGQALLRGLGIEVGDRDAIEIAKDVVRLFHGKDRDISESGVFRVQALRGVKQLSRDYREHHGEFEDLAKFTNAGGGDTIIDTKFARNMKTGQAGLDVAKERIKRAYDKGIGDATEWVARNGSGAIAGGVEWATEHPGMAGGALLAGVFGRNLLKAHRSGGAGNLISGALGMGGAQRVFVVNWPGTLAGPGGSGGPGGAAGKFGKVANVLGALGTGLAAGAALGSYLEETHGDKIDAVLGDPFGVNRDKRQLAGMDAELHRLKSIRDQKRAARLVDAGLLMPTLMAERAGAQAITQEFKPTVNIAINGDQVDVNTDGTRKPEVKLKRGASR
jgi:hypothetical protein